MAATLSLISGPMAPLYTIWIWSAHPELLLLWLTACFPFYTPPSHKLLKTNRYLLSFQLSFDFPYLSLPSYDQEKCQKLPFQCQLFPSLYLKPTGSTITLFNLQPRAKVRSSVILSHQSGLFSGSRLLLSRGLMASLSENVSFFTPSPAHYKDLIAVFPKQTDRAHFFSSPRFLKHPSVPGFPQPSSQMEVTCGLTARLNEGFPSVSGLQKELSQQSVLGDGPGQETSTVTGNTAACRKTCAEAWFNMLFSSKTILRWKTLESICSKFRLVISLCSHQMSIQCLSGRLNNGSLVSSSTVK